MSPPIERLDRNVGDEPPVIKDPGGMVTMFVLALIAGYIRFCAMLVLGIFVLYEIIRAIVAVVYRHVHGN